MRFSISILSCIFLPLISLAQQTQSTTDTLNIKERKTAYRVVVRSDKTFYMRTRTRSSSRFDFGTYQRENDELRLKLFDSLSIDMKEEAKTKSDTGAYTTFIIQDCYGHRIDDLQINFNGKVAYDTTISSDINGELRVSRGKYTRYFTEIDEAMQGADYYFDLTHGQLLSPNTGRIVVTLCIPKNATKAGNYRKENLYLGPSPPHNRKQVRA